MREASRYGSPSESPGFLLWRTTNRWQRALREALAPHGLTHVQFVLLATLTWHAGDEPVTQARLAELAATDAMMTSQVLRALERKRLVTRRRHAADGRARALAPTPAGRALAAAAVRSVEAADEAFFAACGDRAAFTRELQALAL